MQQLLSNRRQLIISAAILVGFIISLFLVRQATDVSEMPKAISDPFKFAEWVNAAENWLKDNFRWFTRMIANGIEEVLYLVEDFLILSPWLFVLMLFVLPSLYFGGLPLAILTVCGGLFWGGVGMWEASMQTLALMGMAVALSIIIGVLLGVACSQNDRVEAILKPILDTMQTMPAFVYLLPAVFFFGIGGPPAIMATMIYALPPVIRLTNLGIRQLPHETIEAAQSFGASKMQMLWKVQLPLSLPSIMLGINQTIMMALGLVVLATFIGAEGLGSEVWKAISKLRVGWSLEGGLCSVFMAIIFDRLSLALGKPAAKALPPNTIPFRLFPQNWDNIPVAIAVERSIGTIWDAIGLFMQLIVHGLATAVQASLGRVHNFGNSIAAFMRRHVFFMASLVILIILWLYDAMGPGIGEFPDSMRFSLREPVDNAVAWLTINPAFIAFTKGLRAFVYFYLLHPLDLYLTHLPWYIVVGVCGLVGWLSVGRNFAVTCVLLLLFIGATDLWQEAMLTLSSVLVSVFVCCAIGLPIGIAAAYSKRFDAILKPVMDAMQTLPSFVYLIPVLMFFGGNVVSAVIATVIYALPPVIRLTTLGISQIPVTYNEVSSSFGGTPAQTLCKVKLPMALPSIMLGLNQSVMMALAMQVVTPLIGGGGLGREVFNALNISNTGLGLASGTGIVLLAIILDRLSQAWTQNQRKALGL
ncbi:MAG: glycine betaine/proline transport system permease protein [Parasphingorhabdus sp.]|jgi:glycine betaine/proline transport system permease protein